MDLFGDDTFKKRTEKPEKFKRPLPPKRVRPQGMSREAFALFNYTASRAAEQSSELMQSLIPRTDTGYKENKAQLGLIRPRKYNWVPFVNHAREDNLQLFHWEREDKRNLPYPFAAMNKVIQIEKYTDDEYWSNFSEDGWTKAETDHLFDIAIRFDLRWPIIHDRYDHKAFNPRTMEELKGRFYSITNWLQTNRDKDNNTKVYAYDAEHETRRKMQLELQWNRTEEDLEEEQELLGYLKIYDAKKKERAKKAGELQSFMDSLAKEEEKELFGDSEIAKPKKRTPRVSSRGRPSRPVNSKPIKYDKFNEEHALKHFRWSTFDKPGVHLRSQEHAELKVKNSRRQTNLTKLMHHYAIPELHVLNYPELMDVSKSFKANVCILQDLKDTLAAAEYELMVLQQQHPDKVDVPEMFKVTPVTGGPVPKDLVGKEGMPSSARIATAMIEMLEKEKKV